VIRFLTETDYPPFNFTGPDGNPAGFNVDLARLICEEIKVTCTIQMRRFETLLDAITSNRGDAIIASIGGDAATARPVDFTDPYYRAPARFVSRRDAVMPEVRPNISKARRSASSPAPRTRPISRRCSPTPSCTPIPMTRRCGWRLRRGEVDFIFGDAISLAFWINGTDSAELLRLLAAGRSSRAAISAKASASPCARATTCCGRR
jgi:polar amino acid transport system substrate-binding protein